MVAETLDPAKLPSYQYESYSEIGLNDLLTHVVHFLEGHKQAATFENITVAAHRMFPGKFSLVGYPQFPDATRIQLVILHLGPKYVGWLEGKKKTGYYLNARGREAAKAASLRLGASQSGSDPASEITQDNLANRTAVETRIARLRNSTSFKQFAAGDGQNIDDVTLSWEAFGLFITADGLTKAETHRQLLEVARRQRDRDVEQFLNWVSRERPYLVGRGGGSQAQTKRRNVKGRNRR
ncbi:MAG: hypothetical protein HYY01_06415 [Chloroflexi bacterium]|nr:hypothetical protein [Chloroflexota bacterium]